MRGPVFAERTETPPVQITPEPMPLPLPLQLLNWLFRSVGRLARWVVRHPVTTLVLGSSAVTWQTAQAYGLWVVPLALALVVSGLVFWRTRWPQSFGRHVSARVKGSVRACWYRPQWRSACEALKLYKKMHAQRYLPRLVKVRSQGAVDVVTVRMLPGQTTEDWAACTDAMAHTFDATSCRVKSRPRGARRVIDLRFLTHDPFTQPVPAFRQTKDVDLSALPIAWREEGVPFYLRLNGRNILLVGEPGSGKSSAIQTIVHGLAPAIGAGFVQLHGVDMKGGVELTHVAPLCSTFVYRRPEDAHLLLEWFADDVLAPRLEWMRRNNVRLHQPTAEEPLHVLVVDELAAITAYVTDNALRKKMTNLLSLVLSQGRAAGVVVIGGVQDGRKEVVPMRGLFTYRIAFRLSEAEDINMVLSKGARDRGAYCDQIPTTTPGVAYAEVDGEPEPARIRFPYLSDDQIAASAHAYGGHALADDHGQNVVPLRPDDTTDADASSDEQGGIA